MFKPTPAQESAQKILAGSARHCMLFGGSRSGKTFWHVRNIVLRALKAPQSRHLILRFRFNHVKTSVLLDTFPKVMRLCFPGVEYQQNKSDGYITLPNLSEIWFGGLDDKERTEKILGNEYATIYFNECSQIPWASVGIALTRLAQKAMQEIEGAETKELKPRAFYDCNPPSKAHWTYQLFFKAVDPDTKTPVANPGDYAYYKINPQDNSENLSADYLDTLQGMSARLQKRFLLGEFADATPNALFNDETIDKWRHVGGELPDMVRVVVAVDPSGSGDQDNADNDAIGISVCGLGTDGYAYVLEDATVKAGPATWGRVACSAFERYDADCIVGETNYGGAMVEYVIKSINQRAPFKLVTATRGKVVRAEPISALYEAGKVRHVGRFNELEDELVAFSTFGYVGNGSPNRADALVWGLTELFPGIVAKSTRVVAAKTARAAGASGWMGT